MPSKTTLIAVTFLLSLIVISKSNATGAEPTKPNVIFVLCDDLGWGDFGVLHQNDAEGKKRHRTPNIDKMAAEGIQLRNHYCPAPVCAPSRGSLLTGTHQGHALVRDNQFDKALEDNHTLGTVMKSAGYRTALIGKYGLQGKGDSATNWPAYPTRRGFDDFYGYVRHVDGHVHYPAEHWSLGNSEKHRTPKEVWANENEVSGDLAKCYTTDLFTAKCKHWIVEHTDANADQPFFIYLAYDTPHAALQVPTMAYPEGKGVTGGLQWTGQPGAMINTASGEIDSYRHPEYVNKGWSDVEERFATMVRRIDDAVGDLLQTLRDLKIDENTIVVISSDNGPHKESYLQDVDYDPTSFASFGPFDGIKRDLWEGGIRVPTLAWWPTQIPAGIIDQSPSQSHDWMATFADLAGHPVPARCDGVSLKPVLTGESNRHDGLVYIEYFNGSKTPGYPTFKQSRRKKKRGHQQAIFMDGFKGVRVNISSHNDPFQIYDVNQDPAERHNLTGTSERFDRLQKAMHDRVLQIRRPNDSAPRPYDKEPIPAAKITPGDPGLDWSLHEGNFPYVPQLKSSQPTKQGQAGAFAIASPTVSGAVQFTGYVKVETTGKYELTLRSDAPALLRIHDAVLIDHDFGHKPDQIKTASVKLAAGLHPIQITTLAVADQKVGIDLTWSADAPIKASLFRARE